MPYVALAYYISLFLLGGVCMCVCVLLFPVAAPKDTKPNMETSCACVGVVYPETDNPFGVQEQEEREDKGALAKYTRVSVDRLVARSIGSTNLYQKALGSMLSREQARAREREGGRE